MKKHNQLLILLFAIVFMAAFFIGCSPREPRQKIYRTFEVTYNGRIDTIVATRCSAANWTTGGWAIKAFDDNEVIYTNNLPDNGKHLPFIIRQINN